MSCSLRNVLAACKLANLNLWISASTSATLHQRSIFRTLLNIFSSRTQINLGHSMRTSRIAQDTSKVSKIISPTGSISRRQTRAFAASLSTFKARESEIQDCNVFLKDDSSDLEDYPSALAAPNRKRKRGADTPVTSVSIGTASARTSPREAGVKVEEDELKRSSSKTKRVKRQPARRKVNEAGEVEIHPPTNWEEIYDAVRVMRKRVLAPVDTMGCERLARDTMSERVSLCSSLPVFHHKDLGSVSR